MFLKTNLLGASWISKVITEVTEFFSSKLSSLVESVANFVFQIVLTPIYVIFTGLARIADLIQYFFRKLAGLDGIYLNGEYIEGDIFLSLVNNPTIKQAFISMLVLGGLLLFVFCFIGVIRTAYAKESSKTNPLAPIKAAFRSIVNFVTVPVVCILGIIVGNALLEALDLATSPANSETFSGKIFITMAYDANRARDKESDFYKKYIDRGADEQTSKNNYGIFLDSTEDGTFGQAADLIDKYFASGGEILLPTGDQYGLEVPTKGTDAWASMIGRISTGSFVDDSPTSLSYLNTSQVTIYYNIARMNFVLGLGLMIAIIWVFLSVFMGLIKRLFLLTTLFIVSPPIVAMGPIDDGAALNKWKSAFVSNAISSYAVVVGFNIYLIILGVINQIDFVSSAEYSNTLLTNGANLILRAFIMLGGALFFKDIVGQLAGLIGAGNAYSDGAGKAKAVVDMGVKGASIVATGGIAAGNFAKKAAGSIKNTAQNVSDKISYPKFSEMGDLEREKFKEENPEKYARLMKYNEKEEDKLKQRYIKKHKGEEPTSDVFLNTGRTSKPLYSSGRGMDSLVKFSVEEQKMYGNKDFQKNRRASEKFAKQEELKATLKNSMVVDAARRVTNYFSMNIAKGMEKYSNFGLTPDEIKKKEGIRTDNKEILKGVNAVKDEIVAKALKASKAGDVDQFAEYKGLLNTINKNITSGIYFSSKFAEQQAKADKQLADQQELVKNLSMEFHKQKEGTEEQKMLADKVAAEVKKLQTLEKDREKTIISGK